jgi:cytochrome c5
MNQPSVRTARRSLSLYGALLAASVGIAGAAACGPKTEGPSAATPAATGAETAGPAAAAPADAVAMKALVEKRCVGCHGVDKVYEKKHDAAGWEPIMADMEKRGLKIGAEERKQIIDYLGSL